MTTSNIRMARVAGVVAALVLPLAAAAAEPTDAQIDAAMKKADPDNDGTVSLAEAKRFGISAAIFAKANPDKDGTLDRAEFLKAIRMQFEAADPDKDGTLDLKEAKKAGVRSKSTFDKSNPDKDKTLDLAEYLDALTRQAK